MLVKQPPSVMEHIATNCVILTLYEMYHFIPLLQTTCSMNQQDYLSYIKELFQYL